MTDHAVPLCAEAFLSQECVVIATNWLFGYLEEEKGALEFRILSIDRHRWRLQD